MKKNATQPDSAQDKKPDQSNKKPTQTAVILKHLQSGKSITSMEAFHRYNATRLAAIIHSLRQCGHTIVTTEERHEGGTHGRYLLISPVANDSDLQHDKSA